LGFCWLPSLASHAIPSYGSAHTRMRYPTILKYFFFQMPYQWKPIQDLPIGLQHLGDPIAAQRYMGSTAISILRSAAFTHLNLTYGSGQDAYITCGHSTSHGTESNFYPAECDDFVFGDLYASTMGAHLSPPNEAPTFGGRNRGTALYGLNCHRHFALCRPESFGEEVLGRDPSRTTSSKEKSSKIKKNGRQGIFFGD
jgi:hypothetical protein